MTGYMSPQENLFPLCYIM